MSKVRVLISEMVSIVTGGTGTLSGKSQEDGLKQGPHLHPLFSQHYFLDCWNKWVDLGILPYDNNLS